jgi:hypothetical protein
MPTLPARPSLQHLRKQAKALRRERGVPLHRAQHELARSYGFASWPRLVRHVQAAGLEGIERALALAEPAVLAPLLDADPAAATTSVAGLPPLLALLRRSTGTPADVRRCAELLLDTGADPGSRAAENGGEWYRSALFEAVERRDLTLARLLVERGADLADCAFDDEGPTPLDCAIWGAQNNRAADGDYAGTVALLLAADAPTQHEPPTGDPELDALLTGR